VPELDRDTAQHWIERWDRQQEESLPDREERFTALIDAVEEGAGRPDPLVLDIGCGPGSLGVRLLERLPRAMVIGIDADPVSLVLGRAAYRDVPGLRLVDLDLRVPGWSARLGLNPRARVDADLALWDPLDRRTIDGARMHSRAGYSPYDGWTVQGWPRHVIRRGQTLLADGSSLAQPGQGQWVRRNRG
jgi:SAM-dependent methyltransferase